VRHTIEKEARVDRLGDFPVREGEKSEFSTIIQPEGKSFSITVGHHGRLLHKEKVSNRGSGEGPPTRKKRWPRR